MTKRIILISVIISTLSFVSLQIFGTERYGTTYNENKYVQYDGNYTKTNYSVTIYTESGHCKGSYSIYLHKGKKYIKFNNVWICIQGKNRFAYNGNWYVIK
ncbi:hypothetical protein [Prevotella sp.]|uniref:hypothetical protein n=1 Tax=Prevotella sp. TaxID=59823 RepID=UPI003AB75EC2